MAFSTAHQETLAAAANRIIPEDDFPSAWKAGAGEYISRILAGDLRDRAEEFERGLAGLDAEAIARSGQSFSSLKPETQDEILRSVETAWPQFFELLVTLVSESYYTDPGSGGNRDRISWRMVGYDPKT
jgi:hypothetical protein